MLPPTLVGRHIERVRQQSVPRAARVKAAGGVPGAACGRQRSSRPVFVRPVTEPAGPGIDRVDATVFRDTLARVPTPVTVVTSHIDRKPHGTTVSAFSSLSLEPPMILVSLDQNSDLLKVI